MSTDRNKPNLSKSQYVLGKQCPLALWNFRKAAEQAANTNAAPSTVQPPTDPDGSAPAALSPIVSPKEAGHEVGELAQTCFPGGVTVTDDPQDTAACVAATKKLIGDGHEVIFEATAVNPADGGSAHIDILRKVAGTDEWDLIEVKSTAKAKAYHYDDIAYQYHVFTGAGYKIRNAFLMLVDDKFRKQGPVDPHKFFRLQNVTKAVTERQAAIPAAVQEMGDKLAQSAPPQETIGSRCNNPHECAYKSKCWAGAPLYSIFNAFSGKEADAVYAKTGSLDIKNLPAGLVPGKDPKKIELEAHKTGKEHCDVPALQQFLKKLEYPLYYLDYETAMSTIPTYDGTVPFQQVPFQFSLHVQDKPGGKLRHFAYIHKDRGDPREAFAKELIRVCGDKGSVIVYFQQFEEGRNRELAADLPHHAAKLNAISARMVDLFEPFSNRALYSPDQKGSVSIKKVLDAYTPLNYNSMNIPNGAVAQERYMNFINGVTTDAAEIQQLWKDLDDYCALDTFAMVRILDDVLRVKAKGAAPKKNGPAGKPI